MTGVVKNVAIGLDQTLNTYEQRWEVVNLSNEVVTANVAAAKAARLAAFDAALEAHYEATAKQRRYTNKVTCAMRAGYPGPFQAEGLAFGQWMDNSYAAAYVILAEVQAGERKPPATVKALIDELPSMVWPA